MVAMGVRKGGKGRLVGVIHDVFAAICYFCCVLKELVRFSLKMTVIVVFTFCRVFKELALFSLR